MAFVPQHDPNPGFGRVSVLDILKSFGAFGAVSLQAVFFLLSQVVRPLRRQTKTSLRKEFRIFILRKLFERLPTAALRRPHSIDHVLTSKRYGPRAAQFVEHVDRPDFSGIWLCKSGSDSTDSTPHAPSTADVVIVFAHGGGYVVGQPGLYASFLLRVAEGVATRGQTVAVFALDYSLAPEHVFPCQLQQMAACWEYMVGEMGIPASKLALMGDSAGGSLCLSFLVHLASPLATAPIVTDRSRPGRGLFLVSPWVSLLSETGYSAKESGDYLAIRKVREWAAMETQGVSRDQVDKYLEFAGGRDDLADVLPPYTWVSAGGEELFADNISSFVAAARAAGRRVDLDIKAGGVHDWQVAEAVQQQSALLEQEPGAALGAGLMPGADAIAEAVAAAGCVQGCEHSVKRSLARTD